MSFIDYQSTIVFSFLCFILLIILLSSIYPLVLQLLVQQYQNLLIPKVILAVNITVKMQGDGVFINYEITELFTINFTLPIMLLCNQQNKYCEDTVFSIIRRKDPLMLDLIVDRYYSSITFYRSSLHSSLSLYRSLIVRSSLLSLISFALLYVYWFYVYWF